MLLHRCWTVEHNFGLLSRFRRLSHNFERLPPQLLAALKFLIFTSFMLPKASML